MRLNKQKFTAWDRTHGDHDAVTYHFDSKESLKDNLRRLKRKHKGNYFYFKQKEIDRGPFMDYLLTFHLGKKDWSAKWANKKHL